MVASVVIHLSEVFQISIFLSETTAQNVSSHDRNVSLQSMGFPVSWTTKMAATT